VFAVLAGFSDLPFDHEAGGDIFLRNVSCHLKDYTVLYISESLPLPALLWSLNSCQTCN
jgi:hypothetical protein